MDSTAFLGGGPPRSGGLENKTALTDRGRWDRWPTPSAGGCRPTGPALRHTEKTLAAGLRVADCLPKNTTTSPPHALLCSGTATLLPSPGRPVTMVEVTLTDPHGGHKR